MAAGNQLKTPFVDSLDRFARRRLRDAFHAYGKALPVSVVQVLPGPLYLVKFEITDPVYTLQNVTVPMIGPEFIRFPIQPKATGLVVSADASLAPTAGLATGTADLSVQANLESLVFMPCSTKNWPQISSDGKTLILYGFDGSGVLLQDQADSPNTMVTINKNTVTIKVPSGKTIVATAGGTPHAVETVSGPSTVLQADA